jgi:hypothetical protein
MCRFALLAGALLAAAIPAPARTGAAPARPDYVPDDLWRDEHRAAFYERWFGDQLHDMGEPVLSHPGGLGPYRRRFRMLVLSHYRPAFAMRIDASSMGGVMHLVSLDGRSIDEPDPIARRRRLPLSGDDVRALNNMIDGAGLGGMAVQSPPYREPVPDPVTGRTTIQLCVHATYYVFEQVTGRGSRFFVRDTCEMPDRLRALIDELSRVGSDTGFR